MSKVELLSSPEQEPQKGPFIIDNIGIQRGTEVLDIYGNPQEIRKFMLGMVEKKKPNLVPQAETHLDRLTLSLGARPYLDLAREMHERKLTKEGWTEPFKGIFSKLDSASLIVFQLAGFGVGGVYFYDEEKPVLYINFGNPLVELGDYSKTLTHESEHFIQGLEPVVPPDTKIEIASLLSRVAIIDFIISTPVTFIKELRDIKKKPPISRREFFAEVARQMPRSMIYFTLPSVLMEYGFRMTNSPNESDAFKTPEAMASNEETFNKMFKIVKR